MWGHLPHTFKNSLVHFPKETEKLNNEVTEYKMDIDEINKKYPRKEVQKSEAHKKQVQSTQGRRTKQR